MTEFAHRLALALAAPVTDPDSRTYWVWLVVAAGVATVWHLGRGGSVSSVPRGALGVHLWGHRSSRLDLQLLVARRLLSLLWAGPKLGAAWLVGTTLARALDHALGVPALPAVSPGMLTVGYSIALFVAWDLSRFVLHRAMHGVPLLWQFHQVHHSAEVLTPLTFHRVHPVEGGLYEVRGALVGGGMAGLAFWLFRGAAVEYTILGVHAVGLALNAATGNLRHSHVWWSFGPVVERWLLSPAQHQLHHGLDRAEHGCNFGTWLGAWDRLAGSHRLAPAEPPAFGVDAAERNHGDDLLSVLVGPFVGAARRLVGSVHGR